MRGQERKSRGLARPGGGAQEWSMFDCMEAVGMAPRQLFRMGGQGACMLQTGSPFFTGLDRFAWTGAACLQCKLSPCLEALFTLMEMSGGGDIITVRKKADSV